MAIVLASMMLAPGFAPALAVDEMPAASATAAPVAAKFSVQVLGQVKNPGNLDLDAGARLSDALIKAGAFPAETVGVRPLAAAVAELACESGGADLHRVYFMRPAATDSSKSTTTYQIDVWRARQQHDLRYDPLLQQNDKIYVPECRAMPRRYPVPPIAPNYTR